MGLGDTSEETITGVQASDDGGSQWGGRMLGPAVCSGLCVVSERKGKAEHSLVDFVLTTGQGCHFTEIQKISEGRRPGEKIRWFCFVLFLTLYTLMYNTQKSTQIIIVHRDEFLLSK